MKIFNKISSDDFFQNYWQKKPLLIKDAIEDFESPLEADDLAGLACEEDIDSRLILETGGQKPWEVIAGPLEDETLRNLPESNWSLSVQGVDRLIPEVSKLLSHFKFLPNWLLDDILVSYAPDKGSVGAHIDNYDVFIIQAQGKRQWLLGGAAQYDEKYREGLDIRLLQDFEPEYDWELSSGDVLYIPTRFAHHGIAVGECLNYSVGFRPPTDTELVRSLSTWASENEISEKFFRDANLSLQESAGEVTERSLSALAEHMKSFIDSPNFKQWFGEHISEPKTFFEPVDSELHLSSQQLEQKLNDGESLIAAEGLKRCWINADEPMLFIEGEQIKSSQALSSKELAMLCDSDEITKEHLLSSQDGFKQLLSTVYNKGYFVFKNEI